MISNLNTNIDIRFTANNYNKIQNDLIKASKNLHNANKNSLEMVQLNKTSSKFYEIISKPFKMMLNSKRYDNFIKPMIESGEGIQSETFQKLLILGNTGKECIRSLFYVGLTFTNQDLPYDKRLFVSLFHLGVGIVSTSLQLVVGLGAIKYQDKIIENMLKKLNLKKTIHEKTKSGLKFFIPLVLTNIVVKRLIAPAFATPFAGIQKKRIMETDDYTTLKINRGF